MQGGHCDHRDETGARRASSHPWSRHRILPEGRGTTEPPASRTSQTRPPIRLSSSRRGYPVNDGDVVGVVGFVVFGLVAGAGAGPAAKPLAPPAIVLGVVPLRASFPLDPTL